MRLKSPRCFLPRPYAAAAELLADVNIAPMRAPAKLRSTVVRKSGTWLKTARFTAAWARGRSSSYLQAQFLRLSRARRGAKKAILAVAASMLTAPTPILRDGVPYHDLGSHSLINAITTSPSDD
ncbi:hypothetical protein [Mesorhizobium silamurunense]|uniref:hypothetical protein n=1 Tax=Mesorhizobium silamurunense TaxID=499528 RepID=UPI001786AE7B